MIRSMIRRRIIEHRHAPMVERGHSRGCNGLGLIIPRWVPQWFTRAIFEIDPLLLDHQWPLLHQGMDSADIFPNDAHKQHLDRHEEKYADDQWGDANGKVAPKD